MGRRLKIDNRLEKPRCVVVGTGIGGATLGYELAKAGYDVLFLESGKDRDSETLYCPEFPELKTSVGSWYARAGRSLTKFRDKSGKKEHYLFPLLGEGVGGSSALFGMAMERMHPQDFDHQKVPLSNDGLSTAWPYRYEELQGYYDKAEQLYKVSGERDPLRFSSGLELKSAPELSPANRELKKFLNFRGLNPYRLPVSCLFVKGCMECQGALCPNECKIDGYQAALKPALKLEGAKILYNSKVLRVAIEENKASSVVVEINGKREEIEAEYIFLAAGALNTPIILQRSGIDLPRLGQGLMRHIIDLFVLDIKIDSPESITKELAFTDYGSVIQSFGKMPPSSFIIRSLINKCEINKRTIVAFFLRKFEKWMGLLLDTVIKEKIVLASIIEEEPQNSNSVKLDTESDQVTISYNMNARDRLKTEEIRSKVLSLLSPFKVKLLKSAKDNSLLGHVCGTCRMGLQREDSVVDSSYKVHGLENVYVVDSSIFPRSGSQNPSLTIAANAIRCAELFDDSSVRSV